MSDSDRRSPNVKDRGRAKYFHGRKGILADFKERLEFARDDPEEGTTFLIQAAPGAGKSALLHECARLAAIKGFALAEVDPHKLLDPEVLHESIDTSWMRWRRWLTQGSASIDVGVFKAGVVVGGAAKTPLGVIEEGKGGLVLLLDEAQLMSDLAVGTGIPFIGAKALLTAIHNGRTGRPVMLIAAGLSATKRAFKDLGVSRFKANCYVELGPLKPEAERKVIRDWLKKEGRTKGDPTPWIDAIMQKTHGWPQHVAAYAESAAIHLRATGRQMTPAKLKEVLELGEIQRTKFYKSRAEGLDEDHRMAIAEAFVSAREDQTQSRKAIMESLVKAVGKQEADTVFKRALHNGVLDHRDGRYAIPIPSMRRWFIANYYIERDPPDQSPPSLDFPPDSPFDPPSGEFPLGHGHFPDADRDLER